MCLQIDWIILVRVLVLAPELVLVLELVLVPVHAVERDNREMPSEE